MLSAEELLSQLKDMSLEAESSNLRNALLQSVQKFQLCVREGNFGQLQNLATALVSTSTTLSASQPEDFDRRESLAAMAVLGRLALRFLENVAPRQEALQELEMTPAMRMVLGVIARAGRIQAAALRKELYSQFQMKTTQSNLNRYIKRLSDARFIVVDRRKKFPWYEVTDDGRRTDASFRKPRRLQLVSSGPGQPRQGRVFNIHPTFDIRAKEGA